MDRPGFVKKLVAKSSMNEHDAAAFVDTLVGVMADYFKKGEKVVIAEFGSFYVKEDKTVQFNPSSRLKEFVG